MRVLFSQNNCPFCERCEMAVVLANPSLPIDKKIDIIDIYSGDTRLAFFEEYYGVSSPQLWAVPVMVLDKDILGKKLGNYMKVTGERVVIHGVYFIEHTLELIQRLAE